jgi:hypothetical protein
LFAGCLNEEAAEKVHKDLEKLYEAQEATGKSEDDELKTDEEIWTEVVVQVIADETLEHITQEGNETTERANSSNWTFLGCTQGGEADLNWQLVHVA